MGAALCVPVALVDPAPDDTTAPVPIPAVDPRAADAFLDAWRESRTGTWRVEATFTRELADGRSLRAAVVTVQRPPDRLEVGLGSVEGRRDGERFACSAADDGELRCRAAETTLTYEEEVEREIGRLAALVRERADRLALYTVAHRGSCFDLRLRFSYPAAPYGDEAMFCFDDETGALTRTEIRRPEGVDRTVADEVDAVVSAEDLRSPARVEMPIVGERVVAGGGSG